MTKGWTEERRKKAAESIRKTKPWEKSTGPRTAKGKIASSKNAFKHGLYGRDAKEIIRLLQANREFVKGALNLARSSFIRNELIKNLMKTKAAPPTPFVFEERTDICGFAASPVNDKLKTMIPALTLPPAPWMTSPETSAVMNALNGQGGEPKALFVGGCVRNMLLGVPQGDIDIATLLTPPQATELLERAGLKVIPTGIDHGTITAISGGKPYEITTLRRDVETDGRRAVVAFSDDWAEDAQRRDFTMNTLLADASGHVFDPTGQGMADLRAGRVVFVGDPATRIAEDVLRILRFFRFHALYGKGAPDPAALAACRDQAHKIPELSRERISQEFFRILSVDNFVDILGILFNNRILPSFVFDGYRPETVDDMKSITIAQRLFIVADLSVDNVRVMEKLLVIPKALWREIDALNGAIKSAYDTEQAVKAGLYRHGRGAMRAALRIQNRQAFYDLAEHFEIPEFPLTGKDLISLGSAEGPALGAMLSKLEDDWVAAGFDPAVLREYRRKP